MHGDLLESQTFSPSSFITKFLHRASNRTHTHTHTRTRARAHDMRYRFDPGVLYTIYGNDLERFVIWRANVGHRTLTVFLGNHAVLKRAVTPYHFPTETSGPSGA